jgi:hypothetical protein
MQDGHPALPSPSTQPVKGDTQVESTHHVVTPLEVARTEAVLIAFADPATDAAITVMTTAAMRPIRRTVHSYSTRAWHLVRHPDTFSIPHLDASVAKRIITLWLVPLRRWKSTSTARSPFMSKSLLPSAGP